MNIRVSTGPWLALALIGITAAGCSRPAPHAAVATAPASAAAPAVAAPSRAPREPGPYESPRPVGPREPTPLPDLGVSEPGEPAAKAGRQVQRCVARGRITYVDLNATCPDGPGERVTVFPTEGVEIAH